MSGTLSQTDICNLALQRIGMRRIQAITDQTDPNAIACNVGWQQALAEVSRESPWNCLKKRVALTQLAPAADSPAANPDIPAGTPYWAPNTNYAVNDYVLFGGPAYLYQCLIANTSSASFPQDLTTGAWFQTTTFANNYLAPNAGNASTLFEWSYAYRLPEDFILLVELNGQSCWSIGAGNTAGSLFEIYQKALYCNTATADIKYTAYEADTTNFDSLFTGALVLNLAAIIATSLRKDNAQLSMEMTQLYQRYLTNARKTNAGESQPRRYNIVSRSRFVGSRYNSTNG